MKATFSSGDKVSNCLARMGPSSTPKKMNDELTGNFGVMLKCYFDSTHPLGLAFLTYFSNSKQAPNLGDPGQLKNTVFNNDFHTRGLPTLPCSDSELVGNFMFETAVALPGLKFTAASSSVVGLGVSRFLEAVLSTEKYAEVTDKGKCLPTEVSLAFDQTTEMDSVKKFCENANCDAASGSFSTEGRQGTAVKYKVSVKSICAGEKVGTSVDVGHISILLGVDESNKPLLTSGVNQLLTAHDPVEFDFARYYSSTNGNVEPSIISTYAKTGLYGSVELLKDSFRKGLDLAERRLEAFQKSLLQIDESLKIDAVAGRFGALESQIRNDLEAVKGIVTMTPFSVTLRKLMFK